jgi:hypothetical protein
MPLLSVETPSAKNWFMPPLLFRETPTAPLSQALPPPIESCVPTSWA